MKTSMMPLYLISLRQLTGRVRVLITLVFAGIPILVAALSDDSPSDMDGMLLNGFFASLVIPLIALSTATASFGNEIEDRTLSNLVLSPVPRWKLVLPKLLASMSISCALVLVSVVVSVTLAYDGDTDVLVATVIASLLTITAYSAVFLWLGLSTSRALLTGLLYVFMWELLFTGFVPGIRFLSIRAYMLGIIRGIDEGRFTDDANIISFPVSLAVLIGISIVFTVLSVRRLRTMDVP